MTAPLAVAVLISGTGSNLKALIDARAAGRLDLDRLERRYGVDPRQRFGAPIQALCSAGLAALDGATLRLTRDALLQVDRLLPAFFGPGHLAPMEARHGA